MSKNNNTAKSFSLLTVVTLSEKIIAFVFEAIIAAYLGRGIITDAYFSAAELFTMIDSSFLSSLTVVALNRFAYHLNNEDEKKAFDSMSNILAFYLPLMTLIGVALFALAEPLSYLAAPGFDNAARALIVRCIRCMAPVPLIVCVNSVELAVLRQKKRFAITGLKSFFISVFGIASIVIFGRGEITNADALSVAYVISMLMFCLLTSVVMLRYGKFRLMMPKFNEEIRLTFRMVLPLMVSYGIARVSLFIDKMIASLLGEGYVTVLTYSHSLYKVVAAICITNLSTIILTDFNDMMTSKKYDAISQKMRSVISAMTVLLIPIMIVSVMCSRDIVKFVYERKNFSADSTVMVADVLVFYALNFLPGMIHGVYNQVMYGSGDTKTPMWISLGCIAVNLCTSLPLIYWIGLPGVAIGTLVSSITSTVICRILMKKYVPGYKGGYTSKFVGDCLISMIPAIGVVLGIRLLKLPALLSFFVSTVLCFLMFIGMLLLFKDSILLENVEMAKKIIRRLTRKNVDR